jgi:hypothetical protein
VELGLYVLDLGCEWCKHGWFGFWVIIIIIVRMEWKILVELVYGLGIRGKIHLGYLNYFLYIMYYYIIVIKCKSNFFIYIKFIKN